MPKGSRRGNGILLDFHVMRHMRDIEALLTYEGTVEIQTLLAGREITGRAPSPDAIASNQAAGRLG